MSVRWLLPSATTFYVATNGNDANDGLSAATAFATFAQAIAVITGQIDFGGQAVTLQAVAGHAAFTGAGLHFKPWVGGGSLTYDGGGGSIAATSDNAIDALVPLPGATLIQNVALSTSGSSGGNNFIGHCVLAFNAQISLGVGVSFGSSIGAHMLATNAGSVVPKSSYSITGGANVHAQGATDSEILVIGILITLTGTPNFTGAFALADFAGAVIFSGVTFSGAATGTRFNAFLNGIVFTGGGGPNFLPGNAAGTTATGGQYV